MKFKNPLNDLGRQALAHTLKTPRIVTASGTVVTYEVASDSALALLEHVFDPAETDAKIIQILTTNPDVDLTKFEAALGIKILGVQRKPKPPSEAVPPSDDIEIGELE